jgi:hypothetical protein
MRLHRAPCIQARSPLSKYLNRADLVTDQCQPCHVAPELLDDICLVGLCPALSAGERKRYHRSKHTTSRGNCKDARQMHVWSAKMRNAATTHLNFDQQRLYASNGLDGMRDAG